MSVIGTRIDSHSRHSYENAPTPLSSAPLNPSIPRSRHSGPPIRHSREGGNPEGVGRGQTTRRLKKIGTSPHFHPLMRPSQGHGDSYENVHPNQPRCRLSTSETCRFVDRWSMAERENVARGLVPRWGRGGAWQNPPRQFAVPNHNSGFSHLGVPATAGMSDCYESMSRTPIRDRPLRQPLIRHLRHPFVNPAPHSSFRRRPESRRGGEGSDYQTIEENRHFTPFSSSYAALARPW